MNINDIHEGQKLVVVSSFGEETRSIANQGVIGSTCTVDIISYENETVLAVFEDNEQWWVDARDLLPKVESAGVANMKRRFFQLPTEDQYDFIQWVKGL